MSRFLPLAAPLAAFQARKPLRVASLIVTIFGDCLLPRGGGAWLHGISTLTRLFEIEPGPVRTAMSRLVTEGLFERERHGRRSFFRIAPQALPQFHEAEQKIYAPERVPWDGQWRLAVLSAPEARRPARLLLQEHGFAALTPSLLMTPNPVNLPHSVADFAFKARLTSGQSERLISQLWPIESLSAQFTQFLRLFAPLSDTLAAGDVLPADQALLARILLIHEYRRLVLKSPALPDGLLPDDWPGTKARHLAARLYPRLVMASELFLEQVMADNDLVLPHGSGQRHPHFGVS